MYQALIFVIINLAVANTEEWWRNTSIYQVYPLSLYDTDSDGYGDLRGVTDKLDYLASLQVETIWLTPIYESPMKDFGYDVSNYRAINPIFGDEEDFLDLVSRVHQLNMKIIMDFVPNHSSDQHEWFLKSVAGEEPYRDYYVWAEAAGWEGDAPIPPNNWLSKVRSSAWSWSQERGQFYYHQYQPAQPDLNFRNRSVILRGNHLSLLWPRLVVQEMKSVLGFWLDRGIDGVRVDAISHLIEDDRLLDEPLSHNPDAVDEWDWKYLDHVYTNNQNETRALVAELATFVKENYGQDKVVVLETDLDIPEIMEYYDCGDIPFNFNLARHLGPEVTAGQVEEEVEGWLAAMGRPGRERVANWVSGSHDISRVASRVSDRLVDHLNMLVLVLPGISVTYQGEEIGMTNTKISWEDTQDPAGLACGPQGYESCSRDPERTPMQWSGQTNAGFSTANHTWLPLNPNYPWLNVEVQESSQESHNTHLAVYRDVMGVRRELSLSKDVFYHTVRDTFIALSDSMALILNFADSETSINLEEFLFQHEIFPFQGEIAARSVNGTDQNQVGTPVGFLEDIKIGPLEAILIRNIFS